MSRQAESFNNFFNDKDILVIDPSRKLRTLIKKILVDSGVSLNKIIFSEEYNESMDLLKSGKGKVVFSSMMIQNKSVNDIVNTHVSVHPNRSEALFFLIVD